MSEVIEQQNAIVLAAAQKFVALGSEIAQRSFDGKESPDQIDQSDKILRYLTVYRKQSSLDEKQLEAILYLLRDLSEANVFPTVDPIVGQEITYLVAGNPTTVDEVMQIQSNGSNLTLADTINFYNFLTASYDSGNARVNVVVGGAATQNTTLTLGAYNLTIGATSSGGLALNFGSDADYDLYYRSSGKLARLAFAGTDGHVLTRVGGALAWAAPSGSGYDTIQNAGSGLTQFSTLNFSGALQAANGTLKTEVTVKNAGITYAMIQNVTNARLLGNATGSAAAPSEISVSAPLALGSSTLSIAQAGTSQDGYLAAADWNTFNSKLGTALTDSYIFVGSGTNVATGVALSGDGSLATNGALTVTWANGYATYDARYLTLSGGTLTGYLTLHADPTNALHAATKNYVDNLITGISWKNEVEAATTADITLSGEQTIDGVTTSESRILVKDQSDATENGIYLTGAGAWSRVADADSGEEIAKATVYVAGGSTHGGTQWTCTNTSITLGATNITWGQISGSGTYTNGVGLSLAGNVFSVTTNGIVNSLIRPSAGLSVIGRSANTTGDVADITSTVDGYVLRQSGTSIGFGTIGNSSITGLAWSKISGTPTTLAGYGITDAISTTLASANIIVGNAGGAAASVSMSGEATISNAGAVTLTNSAVIGKVLTGFTSGAGTVAATDTILQAIQKLDGNIGAISGIGGSTGATDNAILRADGGGGSTLQNSAVTISDAAQISLGVGLSSAQRVIAATSTGGSTSMALQMDDGGSLTLRNSSTSIFSTTLEAGAGVASMSFTIFNTSARILGGGEGEYLEILTIGSVTTGVRSGDLHLQTGTASVGNADSGHIFLDLGAKAGTGKVGNIGLFTTSVADWQDMEKGMFVGDSTTSPTDNPVGGIFKWVSSEPEGSNEIIRTTGGYFAKPVLRAKVTISGGATLQGIGSSPVTIISAPGANKYLNIISITASYNYGATQYDFGGTEVPVFIFTGTAAGGLIATASMNSASDFNTKVADYSGGFTNAPTNTALVLTTADGGNASQGDGDLDVVVYYTIENENT